MPFVGTWFIGEVEAQAPTLKVVVRKAVCVFGFGWRMKQYV